MEASATSVKRMKLVERVERKVIKRSIEVRSLNCPILHKVYEIVEEPFTPVLAEDLSQDPASAQQLPP